MVWICACPIRSITPYRCAASEKPPCMSVPKIMYPNTEVDARRLTAGSHTRIRKLLREIGVSTSVLNRSSSRPIAWTLLCLATSSSHADRLLPGPTAGLDYSLRRPTHRHGRSPPRDGSAPPTAVHRSISNCRVILTVGPQLQKCRSHSNRAPQLGRTARGSVDIVDHFQPEPLPFCSPTLKEAPNFGSVHRRP